MNTLASLLVDDFFEKGDTVRYIGSKLDLMNLEGRIAWLWITGADVTIGKHSYFIKLTDLEKV